MCFLSPIGKLFFYSIRKKEDHLLAPSQPMKDSAHEKSLHFELPVPRIGLFVCKGLSKLLFFSVKKKKKVSPLYSLTLPWFTCRPHVLNCNFLLFPNKPSLLEKYQAVCWFKVNIIFHQLGHPSSSSSSEAW